MYRALGIGISAFLCTTGLTGKLFNEFAEYQKNNNPKFTDWQYNAVKNNYITKYDDYFLGAGAALLLVTTPFVLRGIRREEKEDKPKYSRWIWQYFIKSLCIHQK